MILGQKVIDSLYSFDPLVFELSERSPDSTKRTHLYVGDLRFTNSTLRHRSCTFDDLDVLLHRMRSANA